MSNCSVTSSTGLEEKENIQNNNEILVIERGGGKFRDVKISYPIKQDSGITGGKKGRGVGDLKKFVEQCCKKCKSYKSMYM